MLRTLRAEIEAMSQNGPGVPPQPVVGTVNKRNRFMGRVGWGGGNGRLCLHASDFSVC